MKLIITRHGETEENLHGIIQGHLPGKLSEKGIDQAKKVAQRLKDEKLDFIYSSDLERAASTAREIAKFHPDIPVVFVQDLRERFLGAWQGEKMKVLGFSGNTGILEFSPADGETIEALYTRADNFIKRLLSKHKKSTILCVGHDGICKAMIGVLTGKTPAKIISIKNLHNTAVSVIETDGEKNYRIEVFNCIAHLE
jgi:broad specificity phosphatase PhoE